jgi:hypothetical protein
MQKVAPIAIGAITHAVLRSCPGLVCIGILLIFPRILNIDTLVARDIVVYFILFGSPPSVILYPFSTPVAHVLKIENADILIVYYI